MKKHFLILLALFFYTIPSFAQTPSTYFTSLYNTVKQYRTEAKYNIKVGLAIASEFKKACDDSKLSKNKKALRLFELADKAKNIIDINKKSTPEFISESFYKKILAVKYQVALFVKNNDLNALQKAKNLVDSHEDSLKFWDNLL